MLHSLFYLALSLTPMAVGGLGLTYVFVVLQQRDRQIVVALIVLGIALADVVLYTDTAATQLASAFHPTLGGQNIRLTQIAVLLALGTRWSIRGFPRPTSPATPIWIAFFAWIFVAAVAGILNGHVSSFVVRQAMIIVQVGGGIALAAGVPARDWARDRAVHRFIQWAAVPAALMFVTDTAGVRISSYAIPMLPLSGFGSMGADACTVFASLGLLGLGLGLCLPGTPRPGRRPRHRLSAVGPRVGLVVPSIVLLLAHLASPQRAARVALYVALVLLLGACLGTTARRRAKLTQVQASATVGALVALVLAGVLAAAVAANSESGISPVVDEATSPGGLGFTTRQGSIDSRFNQWEAVKGQILAQPVFGEGLGGVFDHYDVGSKSVVTGDISHNILLDLLRRTGLVGVVLAGWATILVLRSGLEVWRRHSDDAVAGLALTVNAAVVGLLARGMVESIFEKYRLALLLGLLLGIVMSTYVSLAAERTTPGPAELHEASPETARAARGGLTPVRRTSGRLDLSVRVIPGELR